MAALEDPAALTDPAYPEAPATARSHPVDLTAPVVDTSEALTADLMADQQALAPTVSMPEDMATDLLDPATLVLAVVVMVSSAITTMDRTVLALAEHKEAELADHTIQEEQNNPSGSVWSTGAYSSTTPDPEHSRLSSSSSR